MQLEGVSRSRFKGSGVLQNSLQKSVLIVGFGFPWNVSDEVALVSATLAV